MPIKLNPNKSEPQRLRCNNCKKWLVLSIEDQQLEVEDLALQCLMPFLRCLDCSNVYVPGRSFAAVLHMLEDARERGETRGKLTLRLEEMRKERFSFCKGVSFQYDPVDYYYIPGLMRPTSDGFLTPVFFNRDVLVQYYNHPDYSVSFSSDTYGTLHSVHGDIIAFGINRSDKVIMWLGDIDHMPKKEQLYLASKNVGSDHDIGSEFYDGQIEAKFTDYAREQLIVKKLSEFADKVFGKYKVKLLQLDNEALPLIKSLKPPIHFSEREMSDAMEAFNKLLIERINTAVLKEDLRTILGPKEFKELRSLGGLKTLELWLQRRAGVTDASVQLAPLFVLYDLRVVFKHLTSEEARQNSLRSCRNRLGVSHSASAKEIYDRLLAKLVTLYGDL